MSVAINLLPDLRQAKLKDLRRRQLAVGVGITVWVVCGALVALLSVWAAGQKVVINTLTGSIKEKQEALRQVDGLIDALTADQHLASLPALYAKRVYLSKFFESYMAASPVDTTISTLAIDASNSLKITGNAPSYAQVAKLARALEASNVTVGPGAAAGNTPYFKDVTITGVDASDKTVAFTITTTISSGAVTNGAQ